MGFPGVISYYNPTCRGPITPCITGVWAHLGLLITIPSSKMPKLASAFVRNSTVSENIHMNTTKTSSTNETVSKVSGPRRLFLLVWGKQDRRGVGRYRDPGIHGDPGRDLFRQKRPETHHGNSDAWGIFEWSSIPSKSSKISKKPHLGKEFVAMVEVEWLGLVLWCVFFM